MFRRDCNELYLTWNLTNLCCFLVDLHLLSFYPLVREDLYLYPTWINVDMLIRGDLNLHSKWMLIWQPVTLWYTALNLNIARLLNGFLFLNKLLSCFLCAFRWVVSSGRKLAVVYGVSIGNKGMPPSISIKNKGFKMASKSPREDSRWQQWRHRRWPHSRWRCNIFIKWGCMRSKN